MKNIPKLGVGLGFREPLRSNIFLHRASIDFLEITTDHYIDAAPQKLIELDLLNQHFPLIPHSLDLSLGSAEGISEEYLAKVAEVVERVNPAWFSDHICFTGSNGTKLGHLAPVPYTDEALKVFVQNVTRVKKRITVPLILENITYDLRYPSSAMSEAAFIRKVVEETDCGLLLDVTNLYINSRNHGYDWREFLDILPLERVVQLHYVGSLERGNRLIDAHSTETEEEIWEVFREVCRRTVVKGSVLERDENFPAFTEIVSELGKAREICARISLQQNI
ncbi:MAG: DUF692 domain-containing protein [Saprospiraceae bacterium]|nr:DUF692 domain-containing protein [Pyrinomonadaceae bacterium]